jgi:hypothetical protein
MESKLIKRDTAEYEIANQKLEELLDEIELTKERFIKSENKKEADLLLMYLGNYKILGSTLEIFGETNLNDADYKVDLIKNYLSGKINIKMFKEYWSLEE